MEPEKSTSTSIPFDLLDGEEDDMEMSESDDDMLDRTTASVMNALDQSNSENGTKRRKVKHDYTQAYEESEYNVNPTLDANGNEVLTMESLLNDFAEEDGFNQLQKQFRSMTKEKKQQETLVPIPTHLKTKLERETAYIQTKSQVSKVKRVIAFDDPKLTVAQYSVLP
jgi:U3 small nucleolar RNA-associated protein 14